MGVSIRPALFSEFQLFLDLVGPLRLRDARGLDFTPRGRKAQALLALVATSPALRRSRAWAQDKLWSDRGPEQGACSLRQCLTEIRAALGSHVGCLGADRGWIALDADHVQVRDTPTARELAENVEFLEGLDVRDREFEHWIRDQRMLYAQRTLDADAEQWIGEMAAAMPDRPVIGLVTYRGEVEGETPDDPFGDLLLDLVAASLLGSGFEVIDLRLQRSLGSQWSTRAKPSWLLVAGSSVWKDRVRMTLGLSDCLSGRLLWTDVATFERADFYACEPRSVTAQVRRASRAVLAQASRPTALVQEHRGPAILHALLEPHAAEAAAPSGR